MDGWMDEKRLLNNKAMKASQFKLEIRDSQNLAKLGLSGKPSLLVL